jgi:hypothetical protein
MDDECWELAAQTVAQGGEPLAVAHDLRGLPAWLSPDDAAEGAAAVGLEVDADATLAAVLDLVELRDLALAGVTVMWSTRLRRVSDAAGDRIAPAKARRVGDQERALGQSARVRLELSLPWWLVASPLARERACHAALMCWAWDRGWERLHRHLPDIAAHSATLGRYGVTDEREVQAVAHAAAHPLTLLDGPGGQLVWAPTQRAIAAAAERMSATRREDDEPAPTPAPRRRRRQQAEA